MNATVHLPNVTGSWRRTNHHWRQRHCERSEERFYVFVSLELEYCIVFFTTLPVYLDGVNGKTVFSATIRTVGGL